MRNLQTEKETSCRLQQSVQQLQAQLSDTQLLLDKEKAKYTSACRQQEVSVAAKIICHCNQWIYEGGSTGFTYLFIFFTLFYFYT